jgi:hypothetical protein
MQTAIGSKAGPLIPIVIVDLPPLPALTDLFSNTGSSTLPPTTRFGLLQAHLPAEPLALETHKQIAAERAAEAQLPCALDSNFLTTTFSNFSSLF